MGCWLRDGGDGKNGECTSRIETLLKGEKGLNGKRSGDGVIKQEMWQVIESCFIRQMSIYTETETDISSVIEQARRDYKRLHEMPVNSLVERERYYQEHILQSEDLKRLKRAMDEWCAVWFWQMDDESGSVG